MITNRRTVQVKQHCMDAMAAFVLAAAQQTGVAARCRIYKSDLGVRNILAYEIDFDDIAGYDRFWRSFATSTPIEFFREYESMLEHDLMNEIWERVGG